MTKPEKHRLIATELLGWNISIPGRIAFEDFDGPNERIWRIEKERHWDVVDFDPSSDLNLCARAEQVIGERGLTTEYWGLGDAYTRALKRVLQRRGIILADVFHFVTASAQDRVDAMVMLISDITAKRNAHAVGAHDNA